MRRYQKWVATLGMLAAAPGITQAAGPQTAQQKANPAVRLASAEAAQKTPAAARKAPNQNQIVADNVAKALRKANLAGFDINVACQRGVASLEGTVATPQQKQAVYEAVTQVPGVVRVDLSRLAVKQASTRPAASQVQHANAGMQHRAPARAIRPTSAQIAAAYSEEGELQAGPNEGVPQGIPPGVAPRPMPPGTQYPPPVAAPPYGYPAPSGPATMYDQPNYPNYAWPGYAQHPNYAAVTYPKQYSASAWPYIGPFYPYPQVPLGWRQAQLEWDDGYWNLNFRPRTDRWWWFLDYRNW